MQFTSKKPPVPKGYSYVLKSSALQEALIARKVDCNVELVYYLPNRVEEEYIFLECLYWLPNARVDYDRFYISSAAIKLSESRLVSHLLKEKVIPALVDWIIYIKSLSESSTHLKDGLRFRAIFSQAEVRIEL